MSMRANPNIVPDLLSGLNESLQQLDQSDLELGSGRSINQPSDNPAGTSALILNHDAQSQVDSYQQNIGDLQSKLQIADSALSSATTVINQAISLGVEAGNSDLSDSDRQAVAQQISGVQQQLARIANTTAGGVYLFAGTNVETQPFTLDPTAAAGVAYQGNSSATSVQIANGQSVTANVPGDQLFLNSSGSLLGAVNQLLTAVQNNSGISAAVTALGQASTEFNTQRLSYDTSLNELQSTGSFLTNEQVQLSSQETNLDGANIPQVVTQFSQAEIAYSSLLSAEGKILNLPNILDFLQ